MARGVYDCVVDGGTSYMLGDPRSVEGVGCGIAIVALWDRSTRICTRKNTPLLWTHRLCGLSAGEGDFFTLR